MNRLSKPPACVTEMRGLLLLGAAGLVLVPALVLWRSSSSEALIEKRVTPPEAAPLCPWRDPEKDLKVLFPSASGYEVETRILSGLRQELAARLGRNLAADENALHLYRIYRDTTQIGTVVTRRVKGEHGVIEIVVGAGMDGQVRGWRLQRLREPEAVAKILQDPAWVRSFEGKGADSPWHLGADIPEVPPEARFCAEAVVQGARSLLILLAATDEAGSLVPVAAHHH